MADRHVSPEQASNLASRHALVAETEDAVSSICTEALYRLGFTVSCVESGIDAVVSARRHHPSVIFIAVQLRDVSGWEAIKWLRSNPNLGLTPIVVLSTDADEAAEPDGAYPIAHLRKPVSPAAVKRAMAQIAAFQEGETDARR